MQKYLSIPTPIQRWLAPPTFGDDEDKTRAATVFNILTLSMVTFGLIGLAGQIALGAENPRNIPVILATCALMLILREVSRRGRVSLATASFCSILLLGLSLVTYNNGTVRAVNVAGLMVCVVISTLLIGRRMGFVFLILTSVCVFGLARAEIAGSLPPMAIASLVPMNQWLIFTVISLFQWALVSAARNSMVEALARAREGNALRKSAEENLRELNASLEERVAERTAELEGEILERRQVEAVLRVSEERFNKAFHASPIATFITTLAEGRFVDANDSYLTLLSRRRDEVIGRTVMDLNFYSSYEERRDFINRLVNRQVPQGREIQFPATSGGTLDVLVFYELLELESEPCLLSMYYDVTDQKQMQAELRTSEERFRSIIEHSAEQMSLVAADGTLIYESPTAERPLGYPSGAFIGRDLFELIHPDDMERARRMWGQVVGTPGTSVQAAFRLKHADDSWLWMEGTATNLLHVPSVQAVVINYRDVTARKRAEEQIRYQASLLANVNDAIVASDENFIITSWNRAAEDVYGWAGKEAIGQAGEALFKSEFIGKTRAEAIAELREAGEIFAEMIQSRKDGAKIFVEARATALRDAGGEIIGYVSVNRDITVRKQAETTRANLEEDLHRRNERLAFLHQTTLNLLRQNNLDHLVQAIVDEASQLLNTDVGRLALVEGEMLVDRAASPKNLPGEMTAIRLDDDRSVLRQVIDSREPLITAEFSPFSFLTPHTAEAGVRTGVLLPLLTTETCVGVLGAGRVRTDDPFSEEDMYLGGLFTQMAGLTLDNTRLHEALRQEAIHDPLTGLFNRRFMQEALTRELSRAKRNSFPLAVAMLDLDFFKLINDAFGHDAGDEALRQLSSLLQRRFRGSDIACRYGGEEFTLILPEASMFDALIRMEELRGDVKRMEIQFQGKELSQITVSIGIAIYPDHGSTGGALLKAADEALYRAKQGGRDQVIAA